MMVRQDQADLRKEFIESLQPIQCLMNLHFMILQVYFEIFRLFLVVF